MPQIAIIDKAGATQQIELDVQVYKAAADAGMSVPAYLNRTYETNAEKDGTAFEQALAQAGLFMHKDNAYGIRPPSMEEIIKGNAVMNAGVVTRDAQPTSRILFPAVVMQALESALYYDAGGYAGLFEQQIAVSDDINGARFEHPVINFSNVGTTPKNVRRSRPISQGAYPPAMVNISTSDVMRKIPTFSLGLEVTNEAMRATSLSLVTMAMTRQGELERIARIDDFIQAIVWGDIDMGQGSLAARAVKAKALDASIAASAGADVLTHKAWVNWIRRNHRTRTIDWVWCNTNTALAIEARTGRPSYPAQDGDSKIIRPMPDVANPSWNDVKIFLVEDDILPDGMVVGIDSRYAVRRVRNVEADLAVTEEYILKQTQAMRFDFGEIAYRMFEDAFDVLLLGDTAFPNDPRG